MQAQQKIIIWLYSCCFMIFAMAVIGAITRLTESGLSITEWRPITGTLPPLNEAAWEREFALYRESPEFIHKHYWMELADFKKIFFWEWLHRLWGRLIGLVYALPLVWFLFRKQIPPGYGWKLFGLLLLGGAQGVLGWYMVQSGLVDRPSVSHYRLAAHLMLAVLIFGLILWLALDLRAGQKPAPAAESTPQPPLWLGGLALTLLVLTMTWGAFVAGLKAGMIYNTFPLMDGSFTPPEAYGGLIGFLDQAGWVQFAHRWLAVATTLVILVYAYRGRDLWLTGMVMLQLALGIATLLSQVWLPLAALHQAGALILFALLLRALHRSRTGHSRP